jgi:glutathione reductase (NADPH)
VPDEFEKSLRKRGADLVSSAAVFSGEHEVTLAGQSVTFAKAVVASGSVPRPLSFDGSEHIITSDEVLTMPSRPSSVVFIGAGVIAMEFAHVLARAGSNVTLLEMLPRPLSMFDADAVDALLRENERLGIALHTKAEVQRIDKGAEGLRVRYAIDGESRSIEAACVAHGAGRIADYQPLDLAAAGVEVDERGRPRLDPQLRSTSNPDVLFAGDAVPSSPQLSPVATHEGKIAGNNATGADLETPDYRAIPSVVFTVPALAAVGLGEREAKERGHDVDCRESDPSGWRSGRTYAETNAYAKVLIDNKDGALLGAHLFGHGAQETIHAFSFLLRHRLPAKELKEMVAAYPTFHADLAHFV